MKTRINQTPRFSASINSQYEIAQKKNMEQNNSENIKEV